MRYIIFKTAWGAFGYVARGKRLVATFLPQSESSIRRAIRKRWPDAVETPDLLPRLRKQVIDYFAGKPTKFTVEVDLSGVPPFRQDVLKACWRIPYGGTASYADLAQTAGRPGAARAVGGAMAHNPLPLVIPCHRVLRSDGSLGGFSSPRGIKEKERLLLLEKR
ncbi:MAG: methylated-DNA--[protein]-cysteine S-methyltransferase [Phycisphaerae bacterium]